MANTEDRLGALEVRVGKLETWAGPGQAEALAVGQRALRADLAKVRQTQDRHTRALADLKTDVADLKTDLAEVKGTVREILRRLPELRADA
jgi:septal ring factor EnvC (AmiA/AmiB activator)